MSQYSGDIQLLDLSTIEGWVSFRWGDLCWRAPIDIGGPPLPREPEIAEALLRERILANPVGFSALLAETGVVQLECPKPPNWLVPVAVAAVVAGLFWSRR